MILAKTWDDAVQRWLIERAHKHSLFSDRSILRWLNLHLNGTLLIDIGRNTVLDLRDKKLSTGAKHATVNRMLALLRGILNAACTEWGWLEKPPFVKLLTEPRRRIRFLNKNEAMLLLRELPPHLSDMAAFSLATGLRRANVTGLEWSQIDLEKRLAWIHHDQAKAGNAFAVPLNNDAMIVLYKWYKVHSKFVFCYRGNPIRQTSTAAWYKALHRCRISDFKWHDLRHTWASWHVQNGTPLYALQELGGWQSYEMVRRYAHLSADHLSVFAEKIAGVALEGSRIAARNSSCESFNYIRRG